MAQQYQFPLTNDLLTYMTLLSAKPDGLMRDRFGMKLNDYRALAYLEQGMASTPTELSRMLGIAKCKISGLIATLEGRGYLERGPRSSTIRLRVTKSGSAFFGASREAIASMYEESLSTLTPSQRRTFDLGCTATVMTFDGFQLHEEAPDFVYIYLRSFLLTEQFITKTTRKYGLGLTEFRVLFAVLQEEPLQPSVASEQLLIPKSTLSECMKALSRRGLVVLRKIDGRSKEIRLVEEGRDLVERAAIDVDRSFMQDVRAATSVERNLYVQVARKIVDHERELRRSSALR